jgi:hypothetical protein
MSFIQMTPSIRHLWLASAGIVRPVYDDNKWALNAKLGPKRPLIGHKRQFARTDTDAMGADFRYLG